MRLLTLLFDALKALTSRNRRRHTTADHGPIERKRYRTHVDVAPPALSRTRDAAAKDPDETDNTTA